MSELLVRGLEALKVGVCLPTQGVEVTPRVLDLDRLMASIRSILRLATKIRRSFDAMGSASEVRS